MKQQQRRLESEEKFLYQNNINRKDKIIQNHDMTMNMLINKDLKIWKDPNNKLYYRPKAFEEKQKVTKSDISDVIKNIDYIKQYEESQSKNNQQVPQQMMMQMAGQQGSSDTFNPFQ